MSQILTPTQWIAPFIVAALSLLHTQAQAQPALSQSFDLVTVDPPQGDDPERLVFTEGMFFSTACTPYGFPPTAYTREETDAGAAWTATAVSPTEGSIVWQGTLLPNTVTGSATWTKEGQEPSTFTFSGVWAETPLDGHSYEISFIDPATGEASADLLVFTTGTFESTACREYGFVPGPYQVVHHSDIPEPFTAHTVSLTEGEMVWSGSLSEGRIEGAAVWTKEGQEPITYTFSGESQETAPAE